MEEYLDIIDDEDIVIGSAPYSEVHAKNLRHRIVHVFVINKKQEFLLQLRSQKKSTYPGFWTMSIGGHVSAGEDYIDAAIREGKEELGLIFPQNDLTFHGKESYVNDVGHKIYYQTFSLKSNGPFTPSEEEVERIEFFSLPAIHEMVEKGEKIHQEMLLSLERYFGL